LAAAHLVIHSVPATKAPNMMMAVQLVACLAGLAQVATGGASGTSAAGPAAQQK
jgi:hypothetical protein